MFRIGTTSYIVPDDILANVTYLAPLVDDVELVLFDTQDYGSNLPDAALCSGLATLAAAHDLTFTVHLPLDLRLADDGSATHLSLRQAQRAIEATRALTPYAYTLHLDGTALLDSPTPAVLARWRERALAALRVVCGWVDDPARLCLENVERWDPAAFAPLFEELPISRCLDVGHLWLEGRDPVALLPEWLGRARTVHLHGHIADVTDGITERDHASLAHVPAERLDPVTALLGRHFEGVLTLEVFTEDDLLASLAALRQSLARVAQANPSP
jgi:sugar phosphate isomerase/epimerase